MSIPDRNANSSDPINHPYQRDVRSASTNYNISKWLWWRLTDPTLGNDVRDIMEAEANEARHLARLLEALDGAVGDTLEAKMRVPAQKDRLRSLSLRWLRSQRALLDATTASLERRAGGNGH